MKITKRQLKLIIESFVNENVLLFNLLAGCTQSDCTLYSVAPELENLRIPDCVTKEVYPFETINWEEKDMTLSEFQELIESQGYSLSRRRGAVTIDDLGYDDIIVDIKNVPFRLANYLVDTGIIRRSSGGDQDSLKNDELCDVKLYFPIEPNERGEDIVLKNTSYFEGNIILSPEFDTVGHSSQFNKALDSQCNKDFKAVVANINPNITPDDTGVF